MIPINIIFKVVKNNPDDQSIEIKMCRQNSSRPIDDYVPIRVSYDRFDFSSLYNFEESIRELVSDRSLMYLIQEPTLPENKSSSEIESIDFDDLVDKVIAIPYGTDNELNEIELWLHVEDFIE